VNVFYHVLERFYYSAFLTCFKVIIFSRTYLRIWNKCICPRRASAEIYVRRVDDAPWWVTFSIGQTDTGQTDRHTDRTDSRPMHMLSDTDAASVTSTLFSSVCPCLYDYYKITSVVFAGLARSCSIMSCLCGGSGTRGLKLVFLLYTCALHTPGRRVVRRQWRWYDVYKSQFLFCPLLQRRIYGMRPFYLRRDT